MIPATQSREMLLFLRILRDTHTIFTSIVTKPTENIDERLFLEKYQHCAYQTTTFVAF